MSEPSWTALAKGTERYWWSVDLEGEVEKLESYVIWPGPKADPSISKGRWATGQLGQKLQRKEEPKEAEIEKQKKEMEVDEATPHEASVEIQCPKRNVIRVESQETTGPFAGGD